MADAGRNLQPGVEFGHLQAKQPETKRADKGPILGTCCTPTTPRLRELEPTAPLTQRAGSHPGHDMGGMVVFVFRLISDKNENSRPSDSTRVTASVHENKQKQWPGQNSAPGPGPNQH